MDGGGQPYGLPDAPPTALPHLPTPASDNAPTTAYKQLCMFALLIQACCRVPRGRGVSACAFQEQVPEAPATPGRGGSPRAGRRARRAGRIPPKVCDWPLAAAFRGGLF